MNKKINLLLVSLLITFSLFLYLTIHHYSVKLGLSGEGICSISAKLNCDAAAASSFAEIMGIPIAVLGGIFTLFLFGFILFLKFDWIQKSPYSFYTLRFMVGSAALVSLVMGLISLAIVKVVCPFCLGTYVFSFINLYLAWNLFKPIDGFSISNYFTEYRSHLIFLICIPIISWMASGMFLESYGLAELQKMIPEKIQQWKSGPEYAFNPTDGLVVNGTEKKITLVEFADFKCPHCKAASKTIDLFLKGNPQVNFIFKAYPLDGACNKAISSKGDGTRCTMAAWTMCAEKTQQRGLAMHHWLFDKQEELFQVMDLKTYLPQLAKDLNVDTKRLVECADSNETYELINRMADEGSAAKVQGTPTIYMNGRMLPNGQLIDVLKAAINEVK